MPELHLTRWLRCLLAREFSIVSLVKVWDFVFTRNDLQNLDFVCLAMLIKMRSELLSSD